MKEEPSISPDQQLELIERMLEESRKTVLSMGFPSMIWGGFVSIGTALSYAFASWHWYVAIGLLWALLMVSAFLLVVRHDRRKQQQQLKTTSLHKISNEMWIFIFGVMVLYGIVGFLRPQNISLPYALCVVSLLVGTAYWISSSMTRYFLLRIMSALWIVCSIVVLLVPALWSPAVVGICAFLGECMTGIYFYAKERKESE